MIEVKSIHFRNEPDSGKTIKCPDGSAPRITDANDTRKEKTMFASLHTSDYAIGHMPLRGAPRRLLARLSAALDVRRQRAALAALPEAMLADIGLTRDEALSEAQRPLWDVPACWRA